MPGTQQKGKPIQAPGKGREQNVENSAVQRNAKPFLQREMPKMI
jgi:hypothetical protein